MEKLSRIGLSALVTGSVASVISTAALAALAKLEGKGALEPTNATSHWLWGRKSRGRRDVDAAHTAVGYATHHASAVFWAFPFEAWLAMQPPRSAFELIGDAAMMSGIAATVDYGVAPKRITPGWGTRLVGPLDGCGLRRLGGRSGLRRGGVSRASGGSGDGAEVATPATCRR